MEWEIWTRRAGAVKREKCENNSFTSATRKSLSSGSL
jgi:hypothetical protein